MITLCVLACNFLQNIFVPDDFVIVSIGNSLHIDSLLLGFHYVYVVGINVPITVIV